ncbi:hypothetical protein RhiirA5_405876 [Rhizophagus irregularis]|uniref:Uncharacterized protein n=1 Tax=Rhizophagus irregularis TaxID=588596 RepID=A0A2N0QEB0_9GLOM|nr:hypothetical protein RhiirA5_405876 [Rhizophagus irregularis]
MLLDRYPLSFFDEVPKHILESGFVLPKTSITETVMSSHINVTEITDLVAWKHLLSEGAPSKSLSLKNTIPIRNDADFVGHFVEALIADTIQVLLSEIMIFAAPPSYQRTKVHDFPGVFSQPDNGKTLKVVLEEHGMRTLNLSATIDYYRKNRAYVKRGFHVAAEKEEQYNQNNGRTGVLPTFQKRIQKKEGERQSVVEVKHALHSFIYTAQTAIYTTMLGFSRGYLLNTYTGERRTVGPLDRQQMNDIKQTSSTELYVQDSRDKKRSPVGEIEIPIEFAALAFKPGSSTVISVFHKIMDGVDCASETESVLSLINCQLAQQSFDGLANEFTEWANSIAPKRTWSKTGRDHFISYKYCPIQSRTMDTSTTTTNTIVDGLRDETQDTKKGPSILHPTVIKHKVNIKRENEEKKFESEPPENNNEDTLNKSEENVECNDDTGIHGPAEHIGCGKPNNHLEQVEHKAPIGIVENSGVNEETPPQPMDGSKEGGDNLTLIRASDEKTNGPDGSLYPTIFIWGLLILLLFFFIT